MPLSTAIPPDAPHVPDATRKRAKNNSIGIGSDRGVLRIQFPSQLSQQVWGVKQKYLYLGIPDNQENRLVAELLVKDIRLDIYEERLDATCNRYLTTLTKHLPKPVNQEANGLDSSLNKVPNRYRLSRMFEQYLEYKSALLAATTLELSYRRSYGKAFSQCPQNLQDGLKIRSYLLDHYSIVKVKAMLAVIATMIEWAQLHQFLPHNFPNVYKEYSKQLTPVSRRRRPKEINDLIEGGFLEEPDGDYRAFSIEEANFIMEAFEEQMCLTNNLGTPWDQVVKLLFWTGCRHGEAAALKWRAISSDCSKIVFRHSYNYVLKLTKGLKTEKKGTTSRTFPCGPKLQGLLLQLRPENYSPDDYVFQNRKGGPINFATFQQLWVGKIDRKKRVVGILPTLIKQGKVSQYLTPYATRHTYINAQLDAGGRAADIAKWVGNSVATIHKYYESARRKTSIMSVEI